MQGELVRLRGFENRDVAMMAVLREDYGRNRGA